MRHRTAVARVVARAELDRRVLGPDPHAPGVHVQALLDAQRVRLRVAGPPVVEADRVDLGHERAAPHGLQQPRLQRGALDQRPLPRAHDLGAGRGRVQQLGQRHVERVGERVQRVDGRVTLARLEGGDRVARDTRAPRQLERREPRAAAELPDVLTDLHDGHLPIILRNKCAAQWACTVMACG